jgi:hypothetical protein
MVEKTNLTVRIDKVVLEKAKELKLNLSATTEGFLKIASLAKEKKLVNVEELRNAYREVFKDIIAILKKRGITWYIKIGEYKVEAKVKRSDGTSYFEPLIRVYYLTPNDTIEDCFEDPIDEVAQIWNLNDEWPVSRINNAQEIISELVDTIYRSALDNKRKLEEVGILRKVLQELNSDKKESDKNERK